MLNNDILRRIRYTFDFSDAEMMEVFKLADLTVTKEQILNWLKKEEEEDFQSLHDIKLATFLNGLIVKKRGKKEGEQPKPEKTLTNNLILRKLKIALNLKDEDLIQILKLAELNVSAHEISAFFRNPSQPQYRPCKDQILINFLHVMQLKYRID
jgi:uncharacterized protein YehS (DUF1456 family)